MVLPTLGRESSYWIRSGRKSIFWLCSLVLVFVISVTWNNSEAMWYPTSLLDIGDVKTRERQLETIKLEDAEEPIGYNVAIGIDSQEYVVAASALIKSILAHTAEPEKITIHVFYLDSLIDRANCESAYAFVSSMRGHLALHEYSRSEVQVFINPRSDSHGLATPGNYVRFILPQRLPEVDSILWLDSDMLVIKDIVPFFSTTTIASGRYNTDNSNNKNTINKKGLAAFPRMSTPRISWQRTDKIRRKLRKRGVDVTDSLLPSFNAGTIILNLDYWRQNNITAQVQEIAEFNHELKLYGGAGGGSQPPLLFFFSGDRFEQLPSDLVFGSLGGQSFNESEIQLSAPMFLHWNGQHKPWKEDGLNKWAWELHMDVNATTS